MCGILGVASVDRIEQRAWLAKGRDLLIHRGPDAHGEFWSQDGQVGLAHRRLSIVDLSERANQPMTDISGALTIVFNGEIYNFSVLRDELVAKGHSFNSRSDTEVILAAYRAWGPDCVRRLNGMFAIGIYDAKRKLIFLSRDRAGEKPLFYYLSSRELRFGSELKALLVDPALPRRVSVESLDSYLAFGYVPGDNCMLREYKKLMPGHSMTFDLNTGKVRIWRYWSPPTLTIDPTPADDTDYINELEVLIESAVRRQMTTEVPMGVLLSGGVDSSLVTAMAARASNRVRTFTIGFPGHIGLDETPHARLIARHFGTDHTEIIADQVTADLLPRLARQYDDPIVDSSMIPTFLVSENVSRHCKVALGGDGGDELFGGYQFYSRLQWMRENLFWIPRPFLKLFSVSATRLLPLGFKGRSWAQGFEIDSQTGLPRSVPYFDLISRQHLMRGRADWRFTAEKTLLDHTTKQSDIVQCATGRDFGNYLPQDILVKLDRSSMLSSIEMRSPFLDNHLIEFALSKIPSRLKASSKNKKIILKQLASKLLPSTFDQHRKQGFSIPLGEWLKQGSFRNLFHDTLLSADTSFDRAAIIKLLHGQDRGRSNSERIFALVFFELWRQEYKVTL